MILPSANSSRLRRAWVPFFVLAVGLGVTTATSMTLWISAGAAERERFENAVQSATDNIKQRLEIYSLLLRGAAALFSANGDVHPPQFKRYVDSLEVQKNYPGIQGIGWSIRVTQAQVPRLVEVMRESVNPDFKVWPEEPSRPEYHSVVYLEPLDERNRAAIGFDMFSEQTRREAMIRARDTGLPAASAMVTLVQEINDAIQPGFLVFYPVYRHGEVPDTVEARRANLAGFVYSPFRSHDLLDGIFGSQTDPRVDFEVYDGSTARPSEQNLLYRSRETSEVPGGRLAETSYLDVSGRPWTLRFTSRPDVESTGSRILAIGVLSAGSIVSILLFALTRAQARARQQAETAADELGQIEQTLRSSEARFRNLFAQSPVAMQLFNSEGAVVAVNEAWQRLWEMTREQALAYNLFRDPSARDDYFTRQVARAFKGESIRIFPILLDPSRSGRAGRARWVEGLVYPSSDSSQLRQVVVMLQDVTERIAAERELRSARDAADAARRNAEKANKLKDEFVATMSHELRTPLNAILGWAQLIRTSVSSDDQELLQGLATIERNAKLQAQLVEDLLDVSRIIAGKLRLDRRRVELWSVIEAAVESVRPSIDEKQLRLEVHTDDRPHPVFGDPARLQQVVWNLLSNAVKFTPAGGLVELSLKAREKDVIVTVRDTGCGIAPDFLPHVFDRFRQADASTTRRFGGLGLGLGIVRHLVELHGGTVVAASDGEGRGSTFTLTLPLPPRDDDSTDAPASAARREAPSTVQNGPPAESAKQSSQRELPAEAPAAPAVQRALEGLDVLIVEDDADSRQLLGTLIETQGGRVRAVESADRAMEAFADQAPDVLISDISMPGSDGYELIAQIRAFERSHPGGAATRVPAIALTAFARAQDHEKAIAAGFDLHLAKPIDNRALVNAVLRLADRPPVSSEEASATPR